jgi:hypothetical protein
MDTVTRVTWMALLLAVVSVAVASETKDTDGPTHGGARKHKLHLAHPLVTESPVTATRLRFDYRFKNLSHEDAEAHKVAVEGEYAFHRNWSVTVDVPYTFLDPEGHDATDRLGNINVIFKYANFNLSDSGIVWGGGLDGVLPTGNEEKGIGSNHEYELAPFANVGYKNGDWEFIGFGEVGIPGNRNGHDPFDYKLAWHLSSLYHVTEQLALVGEIAGEHEFGGHHGDVNIVTVTPGVKLEPFENDHVKLGAGVELPVTDEREFEARPIVSLFYNF